MTQLTYQPAFDPYHSAFRLLRQRPLIEKLGALFKEQVRILDFYLLFPFRVRDMRLKSAHQRYKALAEKYAFLTPYGEQPDPHLLLTRMEPMQAAALETLSSHGLIDSGAHRGDEVKATRQPLPAPIAQRINDLNAEQADLMEFLEILATQYELLGPQGLKARSGLMEYRYDAV
jgi:hypothetical protein